MGTMTFCCGHAQPDHQRVMVQQSTCIRSQSGGDISARFQVRRNVFLHGRGDGTFEEVANLADWRPRIGPGLRVHDVDLDGWEDVLMTNGFEYDGDNADVQAVIRKMGQLSLQESRRSCFFSKAEHSNYAFRNLHNLRFAETGSDWGFDSPEIRTGWLWLIWTTTAIWMWSVNCLNAPPLIYRNNSSAPRLKCGFKEMRQYARHWSTHHG